MTLALIALFFVLFFGFIAFAVKGLAKQSAKRESSLAELGRYLGGPNDSSTVWGTCNGVEVKLDLTARGSGSSRHAWTHIDVTLPKAYPLALHVRPHSFFDHKLIEKGSMIDVKLGDRAFDEMFLVEAAPEDVAVQLLDAETREFLSSRALQNDRLELVTLDVEGKKQLRFAVRGWLDEMTVAKTTVDAVTRIAARVRDSYAAADTAGEQTAGSDSPYRPERDASAERERAARREQEVAAVEHARKTREKRMRNFVLVFFVLSVAAMGAWFYSNVKRMGG